MKKIIFFFFIFFFISSISFSQSKLSECKETDVSKFNNCFGTHTFKSGAKYEGEYKDNKRDGKGTFTFTNGKKLIGEFKDNEFVR
jgi:hypothetical protein